jgi:hypothetical protein
LVEWLDSFDFNFYVSVLWFCLRAAAWGGGGFVLWKAQLRATHSLQGPFWLGDTANSQPQFYGSLTVMLLFFPWNIQSEFECHIERNVQYSTPELEWTWESCLAWGHQIRLTAIYL